jgi:hypothetical protein
MRKKAFFMIVLLLLTACTPVVFANADISGAVVVENVTFDVDVGVLQPTLQNDYNLFANEKVYVRVTILPELRVNDWQTSKIIENKAYLKKRIELIRIAHFKKSKDFDKLE